MENNPIRSATLRKCNNWYTCANKSDKLLLRGVVGMYNKAESEGDLLRMSIAKNVLKESCMTISEARVIYDYIKSFNEVNKSFCEARDDFTDKLDKLSIK